MAWYLFYGRKLGMSRAEALACPLGEMLDMIACMAIQNGARQRVYAEVDALSDLR